MVVLMFIEISKRKLESYKRAERLAREIRYQLQSESLRDEKRVANFCVHWMDKTGKIKYERPEKVPKMWYE